MLYSEWYWFVNAPGNQMKDLQHGFPKCGSVPLQAHGLHTELKYNKGQNLILIIKANEMHYFSALFGKELYIFRTDLLSIIRSFNTVFTKISTCHTNYVDCPS